VTARNPACCQSKKREIAADQPSGKLLLPLEYLPAEITPTCSAAGVSVQVDGKPRALGRDVTVPITRADGKAYVSVVFFTKDGQLHGKEQVVRLQYKEQRTVPCDE
jgi:hypothetical protein